MEIRHLAAAVSGITLLLAAPLAQAGVAAGDLEAGASVSLTSTKTTDSGFIGGSIGYFFTDILQAKAAVSAIVTDTATFGIFSPGLDAVFFGSRKVAPFVGASYGLSFGDDFTPGVSTDYYEGHGGVKFFIKERASLEAKLTKFEATESAASGRLELSLGLNIYF